MRTSRSSKKQRATYGKASGKTTTAPPRDEDAYEYQLDNLEDNAAAAEAPAAQAPMPLALPLAPPPQEHDHPQASQATSRAKSTPPTFQQPVQQVTEQHIQQEATTNLHLSGIHIHSYPASPTAGHAPVDSAITPLDYHPERFGLTRAARSRTPTNRRIRLTSEAPRTPRTPTRGAWTTPVPETPPVQARAQAPPTQPATAPAGSVTQAAQQEQQTDNTGTAEQAQRTADMPTAETTGDHRSTSTATQFSSSTSSQQKHQRRQRRHKQPHQQVNHCPCYHRRGHMKQCLQRSIPASSLHTQHGMALHRPFWSMHGTAALPLLLNEGHAVLLSDLTGSQEESDADSSGPDDGTDPASRLMSRKEAKAFEREIPWRSIMKLPMTSRHI